MTTTIEQEAPGRVGSFLGGVGTILSLELRQRVRGVAWYVLLGILLVLELGVTVLLTLSSAFLGDEAGQTIYSAIIYFVLLLGTLITPALSGNAINGDRDGGTLATTQVTLITGGQILFGKFLAAWVTAVAFLVASLPFIAWATLVGGVDGAVFLSSFAVLVVELGVIAAIGVGLSGLIGRPLFSVVITYLAVAALCIGTLIAFALGGIAVRSVETTTYYTAASYDETTGIGSDCSADPQINTMDVPRFDRVWGLLAANPFVVLADAAPVHFTEANPYPSDLFGTIKYGVRQAQLAPDLDVEYNDCTQNYGDQPLPQTVLDETVPSWFVGIAAHLVLAALALWGAWMRLRTPARRLGAGTRIA